MLDESSILDGDPSATCLLMKKEILELNSHIEIVKNRNQFLQGRFQFYQFIFEAKPRRALKIKLKP